MTIALSLICLLFHQPILRMLQNYWLHELHHTAVAFHKSPLFHFGSSQMCIVQHVKLSLYGFLEFITRFNTELEQILKVPTRTRMSRKERSWVPQHTIVDTIGYSFLLLSSTVFLKNHSVFEQQKPVFSHIC